MGYTKISISLEPEIAEELKRFAVPRGMSKLVNEALRGVLQGDRLQRLLNDMDAEHGPILDKIKREVDAVEWPD